MTIIPNEFNEIIETQFFKNYIDICLNKYYNEMKRDSQDSSYIYKFVNSSSYNLGEIINEILMEIKNEYQTISKKHMNILFF